MPNMAIINKHDLKRGFKPDLYALWSRLEALFYILLKQGG